MHLKGRRHPSHKVVNAKNFNLFLLLHIQPSSKCHIYNTLSSSWLNPRVCSACHFNPTLSFSHATTPNIKLNYIYTAMESFSLPSPFRTYIMMVEFSTMGKQGKASRQGRERVRENRSDSLRMIPEE